MRRRRALRGLLAATTVGLAGCGGDGGGDGDDGESGDAGDGETGGGTDGDATATPTGTVDGAGDLGVTSSAFADGESVPERYTADGADVSPPLSVSRVPDDAAALALVVDDPDAPSGTFTHWLLWNVPADTTTIPEDQPRQETLPDLGGAAQGTNGFGDVGYRGPSPPADDDPHRYRFRAFALASALDPDPGAERSAVLSAAEDAAVATGTLTGTYGR